MGASHTKTSKVYQDLADQNTKKENTPSTRLTPHPAISSQRSDPEVVRRLNYSSKKSKRNLKRKKNHLIYTPSLENSLILQAYLSALGVSSTDVVAISDLKVLKDRLKITPSRQVIWVDVVSPEVIEQIPEIKECLDQTSYVVCLSSYSEFDSVKACRVLGSKYVLAKPIDQLSVWRVLDTSS